MKTLKNFFTYSNDIAKSSFTWNMVGSMLMAFQSVIFLIVLSHTVGIVEAGIFTIAYANANLFLTVGKYGMRYYQVSDVKNEFSFKTYLNSRYITTVAMLGISLAYLAYVSYRNNYTMEKSLVILWMCIFKMIDSIEDVYHGLYQQNGRLDIASKGLSIRMFSTIVLFGSILLIFKNQLLALIISTIYTSIFLVIFIRLSNGVIDMKEQLSSSRGSMKQLLINCLPLFIGAFLSFYIGNAPKYSIDSQLNDQLQACYGFIAMPVFVIGLLNGFIFNPVINKLSLIWDHGGLKDFIRKSAKQIGVIFIITATCIVGAYLIGIPVLSLLYNTDLQPYRTELLILLLGGGFLGLSGLLSTLITIMRYQKYILAGYAIVALLAVLFSDFFVARYKIMGAAVLYAILMALLAICFLICFYIGLHKRKTKTT